MKIFKYATLFFVLFSALVMAAPNLSATYINYLAAVDEKQDAASVYEDLQSYPSSPVVRVLQGSSLTLMARDAWMPWVKMKRAEEGIVLLERTLSELTPEDNQNQFEGVPVDVFVFFIAATTYTRLPEFFHKKAEGQALLKSVEHDRALQYLIQQRNKP